MGYSMNSIFSVKNAYWLDKEYQILISKDVLGAGCSNANSQTWWKYI